MPSAYQTTRTLEHGGHRYTIYPFDRVAERYDVSRLPFSLKILLENVLRHAGEGSDTDVEAIAGWDPTAAPSQEIPFVPARVLLQDFTGVPAVVDLAAMRDAMEVLGESPERINPLSPVELVIDHSVMVDEYGSAQSLAHNTEIEMARNRERYEFLRWGQEAFDNFRVVPPGTGIVHQVNLEYLARVVFDTDGTLYPDTLVGTDSHTTMINGLGILGWGVGGIEAEAAMLGQPVSMLVPQVVGVKLTGSVPEGVTATDLVLTVTEALRKLGVVGKFVEFYGPGLKSLSLADRATIANMAPEYGATCGLFPVDEATLTYLELTARSAEHIERVRSYMQAMGLWHDDDSPEAEYSDTLTLDLTSLVPSIAGPKRPQDRLPLTEAKSSFEALVGEHERSRDEERGFEDEGGSTAVGNPNVTGAGRAPVSYRGEEFFLEDGAVVIAAITSCTNTSNPAVLVAAGLVARKAVEKGLKSKPWVKTSLAPGSQVVTDYLARAGLLDNLEALGFYLVGYGCTTCIGNAGPLPAPISEAIHQGNLLATSVLSGNRNFEGRIHPDVRANYLASPPLVVAYAIAGTMNLDPYHDPLATTADGAPVYLKDLWPTSAEIEAIVTSTIHAENFAEKYADVFSGNDDWRAIEVPGGSRYTWPESTYVRKPPFFDGMGATPAPLEPVSGARCLVKVGDSITTDHISPAGAIGADSPAGRYLSDAGVAVEDFNSYGSRRGNHEVMMRGTFANVRLKNELVPGSEGSVTVHFPTRSRMSIYDAAMAYAEQEVPLVVIAGREYGTGSSRDWAAKGPALLGVRAVLAESYERIHRANLVGMGILPLEFLAGDSAASLGLTGEEVFSIGRVGPDDREVEVTVAAPAGGDSQTFRARVRIDTPNEYRYYENGGILHYVLRSLAA